MRKFEIVVFCNVALIQAFPPFFPLFALVNVGKQFNAVNRIYMEHLFYQCAMKCMIKGL